MVKPGLVQQQRGKLRALPVVCLNRTLTVLGDGKAKRNVLEELLWRELRSTLLMVSAVAGVSSI